MVGIFRALKPALGEDKQRNVFWGVLTKLVSELHVEQFDLFKTEELLGITRIQDVWGAFVPAAELKESLETS